MSAKAIHTPHCQEITKCGFLIGSNPDTQSDIWYCIGDGRSGIAIVWGEGENQWGMLPMSQCLRVAAKQLRANKAPDSLIACVNASAMAIDPAHVDVDHMAEILADMATVGEQIPKFKSPVAQLQAILAHLKSASTGQQAASPQPHPMTQPIKPYRQIKPLPPTDESQSFNN